MRFRVEEAEHNGRRVWRIVGPGNERVGREAYSSQAEAASECQKFNDAHAALEHALQADEIMGSLSVNHGKVCALIGQAARVHFGRGNYTNFLLPPDVAPKLGDSLLVKGSVITIDEPKEVGPHRGR